MLTASIDWVIVGDAGNEADVTGHPNPAGAVDYAFEIMKYEWTNDLYVQYLNSVDPDGINPNDIFDTRMQNDVYGGIHFAAEMPAGGKYSSKPNMGNKPVNYVTWFDAARVANWVHWGTVAYAHSDASPDAPQNNGAYTLAADGLARSKNPGALAYLPREAEWYKAAYYKGGSQDAGYWDYPTQSDVAPSMVSADAGGNGSAGATGNYANFGRGADWAGMDGNVTTVGTNGAPSAYGAFDLGGNVREWSDLSGPSFELSPTSRLYARGGAYSSEDWNMAVGGRATAILNTAYSQNGFRLARSVINDQPTNIILSSVLISELQPIATGVGIFSTTDPDIGDTFTYSLVTGFGDTDNSSFEIIGNELRTREIFDYETKNTFSIRVSTTDTGGLSFEREFVISVTDLTFNESPTSITLTNVLASIPEGPRVEPIRIADIVITDDALGTNEVRLSGSDADKFEIIGDGLYLKTGAVVDFETSQSLDVTLRVFDETSVAPSLFVNGGFEAGDASGWGLEDSGVTPHWFVTDAVSHSGKYSLFADNWPKRATQTFASPVSIKDILDVTFWSLTDVDASQHVELIYENGTEGLILTTTGGIWQQRSLSGALRSDLGDLLGLSVYTWGASPYLVDTWYDDFDVVVAPTQSLSLDVTNVNDRPSFDLVHDVTLLEDAGQQLVAITGISSGDDVSQPVRLTATSSNPALVPIPTVMYTPGNATGSLFFTPTANRHGSAAITVTLEDGGLDNDLATPEDNATFTHRFQVSITATNRRPVLSVTSSVQMDSVIKDSGPPIGAAGTLVSDLIDAAGPRNNFSDADNDRPGIAVTSVNLQGGRLWFSTDGGTEWREILSANESEAVVLEANELTRVAYSPAAGFIGEVSDVISFRAWDSSGGYANGSVANTKLKAETLALLDNPHPAADADWFQRVEAGPVAFSSARQLLITGSTAFGYRNGRDYHDSRFNVIDVQDPANPTVLSTSQNYLPFGIIRTLAVSDDGNTLVVGTDGGGVKIFDISNAESPVLVKDLNANELWGFYYGDWPAKIIWSQDQNYAFVQNGTNVLTIDVSDPANSRVAAAHQAHQPFGVIRDMVLSPDGTELYLAMALAEPESISLKILDARNPLGLSEKGTLAGQAMSRVGLLPTGEGCHIVLGSSGVGNTLHVVNVTTPSLPAVTDAHFTLGFPTFIRPFDGDLLVGRGDRALGIWDVAQDGSLSFLADTSVAWNVNSYIDVSSGLVFTLSAAGLEVIGVEKPSAFSKESDVVTTAVLTQTPTDVSLSSSAIAEGVAGGATVGTLATTDPDTNDTFTYSLVPGVGDSDNASFEIVGSELRTRDVFDYETKNSYSIRVRTTDAGGLTFEKALTITVTDVNEAPTLDAIQDLQIEEDAGQQVVSLTGISSGDGVAQPVRITATSSNPGLIPNPTVTYISPNATGSLAFTPATDQHGTTTITVTVEDGGFDGDLTTQEDNATFSRTFDVTVTPVYDPGDMGFPNLPEGAGPIDSDAPEEFTTLESGLRVRTLRNSTQLRPSAGSTVTINYFGTLLDGTVIDSSYRRGEPFTANLQSLIMGFSEAVQLLGVGGMMEVIIPASLAYGELGAGQPQTIPPNAPLYFIIELISFQQASPTLLPIEDMSIAEDALEQTVNLAGISAGHGESQPLRITAVSSNPNLIAAPTITHTSPHPTGSLAFTPLPNQHGSATITVTVEDGGLDGDLATAEDNATFSQVFAVTVTPVNDAPVLDPSASLQLSAVFENAGPPVGQVGMLVSDLIDAGGTLNNFFDVDGDLPGIAITGTNLRGGTLWLSTNNGVTWQILDDVSSVSPKLLAADSVSRVYFQPADNYDERIPDVISFAAWDRFGILTQIGTDIDGKAAGDVSGRSVSLSVDGSTLAIGSTHNDVNGIESGHVRVYRWSLAGWHQLGSDIEGEAEFDQSGYQVSLSANGETLAIGAPYNDGNGTDAGQVRIYRWSDGDWRQLGADIDGESVSDGSGRTVALSSDGQTVAIGATLNHGSGNESGHVRIYRFSGSTWQQLGGDIDGESAGDWSGRSLSLSADGETVAIGAPANGDSGISSGHVRIYSFTGTGWQQVGSDIDGEAAGDRSGRSVSLSADGQTVAIGAIGNDGNGSESGHVRVYRWSGMGWQQVGHDIDGEAEGDQSGVSVSLSGDGQTVAIGAFSNDGGGFDSGQVRIFRWSPAGWQQFGNDIDGEATLDWSGDVISLSEDGQTVAIGAYVNDGNGVNSGHVRVFRVLPDVSSLSTATSAVGVEITPTNDSPSSVSLSTAFVDENAAIGTSVGTFVTADPDINDAFDYSLVPGDGDTDNPSFEIVGHELRATEVFDYEAKTSYSIRVRTTDSGGLFFEKTITITVTDVNEAPTDIGLSTTSITENAGSNAVVGTLSTTDPDVGGTFIHTLVAGTGSADNASFNISGNQLRATSSLNFEYQSSYSVRIRSTDQGGLFTEKAFTITVTNVNESPTNIALSSTRIAENAGANAIVGTLSTTDRDVGNTFIYTLVTGTGSTDNAAFSISGSQLRATASFDFETKNSYSVRVRSADQGGLFTEKTFTITVTNVNEAPTDVTLSAYHVAENQAAVTTVGTLFANDPDGSSVFSYVLVPGSGDSDNDAFEVIGSTLKTRRVFDYELRHTYGIRVRATDSQGLYVEKAFTIFITDIDESVPSYLRDARFVSIFMETAGQESAESESVFVVSRAGDLSSDLTVRLGLLGTATPGIDYFVPADTDSNRSFNVSFLPGQDTVTVALKTIQDTVYDPTETVGMVVLRGDGYRAAPGRDRAYAVIGAEGVSGQAVEESFAGSTAAGMMNHRAFLAIRNDGTIVSWGDPQYGGDFAAAESPNARSSYTSVLSAASRFAAINADESAVFGISSGDFTVIPPATDATIGEVGLSAFGGFALSYADGSVAVAGSAQYGGDSRDLDFNGHDNNLIVEQLAATWGAFAARRSDGSVLVWGDPYYGGAAAIVEQGGNATAVNLADPHNGGAVSQIYSNPTAFAAVRDDGSVVTWGRSHNGGLSSHVDFNGPREDLRVVKIYSTDSAFAALRNDGSVVSWGVSSHVGNFATIDFVGAGGERGATHIVSTNRAFAALRNDGSVVSWGVESYGGDATAVDFDGPDDSLGVLQIYSTSRAFAALRSDGSVVSWGDPGYGGNSSDIEFGGPNGDLRVVDIFSNASAFAALRSDGSVVTWGSEYGGDSSLVDFDGPDNDLQVIRVFSSWAAFAALRSDGSVVTWGGTAFGGDSASVEFLGQAGNLKVAYLATPFLNLSVDAAPSATLSSSSPFLVVGEATEITVTLSEPSTSFTLAAISCEGAEISQLTGHGSAFRFLVTPSASNTGSVSVSVPQNAFFDSAGTGNIASVGLIIPVRHAPAAISLSNASLHENAVIGTLIGSLGSSHADTNETFTYSLVPGVGDIDNASFEIIGSELLTRGIFDYETKDTYALRVRTTDSGGLFLEREFTITVTNINEAPTSVSLVNALSQLSETTNTSTATKLADIRVSDDALGSNTLSLSDTDAASFEISNQGSLYLKAGVSLSYATKPTLSVTILARDTSIVGSIPVSIGYTLDIIPRSPHLTTGAGGQLFIDGQPVTYAGSPVTASFQSWTIFEAAVIRGQNVFFGQHSSGVINRLYTNADWSLVGGLYGVGSAYSIYLPRSARGPNVPFILEPEPLPADLLIPMEISGTQLRIDPVGQLYANQTMLTRQGSSAGVKLTDLADYSPIAVMRENTDSTWQHTLLWQHRINQSLIEWQFNSGWGYQGNSRVPSESVGALELAYQFDINRDGSIG